MAKWPELRLQDPETRGPVVLGLTVSTVVLMALFIVARFYGRGVLTSGLGLDDWIMGVAAVQVTHCPMYEKLLICSAGIRRRGINRSSSFFELWIGTTYMGAKTGMVRAVQHGMLCLEI